MVKPWIDGPKELLEHALIHYEKDSPFDYRIAFISIDNAVELMIKTYLGLPKRVTGLTNLSRNDLEKASNSFPKLLDLLEIHCSDKIHGIELENLEWYHRLRNQLYHSGNGISIEDRRIAEYLEISKLLFFNLFEEKINLPTSKNLENNLAGKFIKEWGEFETSFFEEGENPDYLSIREVLIQFADDGILSRNDISKYHELRRFRNDFVHGMIKPSENDLNRALDVLAYFMNEIGV